WTVSRRSLLGWLRLHRRCRGACVADSVCGDPVAGWTCALPRCRMCSCNFVVARRQQQDFLFFSPLCGLRMAARPCADRFSLEFGRLCLGRAAGRHAECCDCWRLWTDTAHAPLRGFACAICERPARILAFACGADLAFPAA